MIKKNKKKAILAGWLFWWVVLPLLRHGDGTAVGGAGVVRTCRNGDAGQQQTQNDKECLFHDVVN